MEVIRQFIQNLTYLNPITDTIDILLVAFIIYKGIMLLRSTSAAQVIKAILALVVMAWLSGLFGLNVISFLLGRTMELGFLALIIMFQPELRRALEHLGSSNLRGIFEPRSNISELSAAITKTVEAAQSLSKDRTGALIVFERVKKLDDYIKTGTILNAAFSAELLRNIFFPKASMHDGAVIIRNAKITAAGCMLPLSSNPNLNKDLGMRHRAGIGMSEASDAVVVIVSEENGSISVAINGTLKRNLAAETLDKLLTNELISDIDSKEKTQKTGLMSWLRKVKKNDKKDI